MLANLNLGEVLLAYFRWHYSRGLEELIENVRNIIAFLFHFFSFKLFLRTLFSPWMQMRERYQRGFHPETILPTLTVNLIMRLVGLISRLAIMFLGLVSIFTFTLLAIVFSIIWLFMPLVLLALLSSATFLIYASI